MNMTGIFKAKQRRSADAEAISSLLGAPDKEFFEVGTVSPNSGDAIIVTLDDPISFFSDNRTLGLVWDDTLKETLARQEEGTTKSYVISSKKGQRLSVWLDSDTVAANIKVVPAAQADDEVAKRDRTAFDNLLDTAEKEKKAQQDNLNNILLGLGVLVAVGLVAAAYAIANTKINPNISVIPGA